MKFYNSIIFLCSIIFLIEVSYAQDEKCNKYLLVEKEISMSLPLDVGEFSRVTEFRVNCETETVIYVKQLALTEEMMTKGFRQRKQRQHTNLHCNKEGIARNGWSVIDNVYDANLKLLVKLITQPNDCV